MTVTTGSAMSVGLFDSGIGGLTVAREVFNNMPYEGIVYFGDTAHVPYGSKTPEQLMGFAREIIDFLITRRVKYIIFACNTSSSVSLDYMRQLYDIPMIGVVRPGARAAVHSSVNGKIGVIATEATVNSGAYEEAIREIAQSHGRGPVEVYSMAAPRLVPLVESGQWCGPETEGILQEYLQPLREKGVDTLVLGCTHYPFLLDTIRAILGSATAIIDPAKHTVRQAREVMVDRGLLVDPLGEARHEYWVSGKAREFSNKGRRFLGMDIPLVRSVNLKKVK